MAHPLTHQAPALRCIGGPYDGREIAWPFNKQHFDVAVPTSKNIGAFTISEDPDTDPDLLKFARVTYRKKLLGYLSEPVYVWAPEDWTEQRIIQHLVENYRAPATSA